MASAQASVDWSANTFIASSKNKTGDPVLTLSNNFKIDDSNSSTDQNKCADDWSELGGILGTLLDSLTGFKDNGFFNLLFTKLLGVDPALGDVGVALSNLISGVGSIIVLPAGGVFLFKNVAADPQ